MPKGEWLASVSETERFTYNLIVTQSGRGVKPRFGKNGEFLPKNLANCPINPLTGFAGSGILRM